MTALHVAAQNASPELLTFLLDHFEAIQAPVNMGVRVKLACGCAWPLPLSTWVEENSAEAWENSKWGDPNGHASDLESNDCTPLHLALCAGQKDNAKLLMTRGADFAYDRRAFSSFHFAAASGQLDVLKAMVEQIDRRLRERGRTRDQSSFSYLLWDVWDLSPLYHAIANGHWDTTVRYLLAEFCRLGRFEEASKILDQRDLKFLREQDEPEYGRYDLGLEAEPVNELVVHVSPSDIHRVPFLHLCCMNSLRGAGADWVERQVSDLTMETFQEKWRPVVIKKLIALGLDPNFGWALPDDPGSTPLIVAARHGNLGAINALLDSGADVQARNEKGHNALMAAMMQRTRSGTIDKADANEFNEIPGLISTLRLIPLQDLWDITEQLLEARIDINALYTHGTKSSTALNMFFHPTLLPTRDHAAMRLDSKEADFVKILIRKGANPFMGRQDPDLSQELFRTAVELALLAAGADPTLRDKSGRYALEVLLDGLEKQPNFVPVFDRFFEPLAQGRETEGALQGKIARLRWLGSLTVPGSLSANTSGEDVEMKDYD
ncbi:Ankyrin repeat-containing domain protein [Rhypophila sp. PSN 637]